MVKLFRELKRKSLLSYILSFTTIIILLILVMGTYLYRFYYETIYDDFIQDNKSWITDVMNRHENDMAILNDIKVQMSLDVNNVEFILKEAPIKSIALKEQLYRYASVSRFFSQIYFFNHKDQYLYNQTTSVDINLFTKEGIVLADTSAEEFKEMLYHEKKGFHALPEQAVEGYLSKILNYPTNSIVIYFTSLEPKNSSTIMFIVQDSYYDSLLGNETDNNRYNCILYNDKIIVSRGLFEIEETLVMAHLDNIDDAQFHTVIGKEEYLITLKSGNSKLVYCTIQPISVFQDKIFSGQWGIIFILFLCSIPASFAIVVLSRRLSQKIKKINALLSEDEGSHYDLQNLESGIRTLVEHNREVKEEGLLFYRTRFINNFIRNEYLDKKTAISHALIANLKIDMEMYAVVLLGNRGNSNENKVYERMLDIISRQEQADGYGIHLINKNQSLFVLFGESIEAIEYLFRQIFEIGKKCCEDFIMAVSEYHNDFADASKAYLEADTAFDNRLLVDNSRIIRFVDITEQEQIELLPYTYIKRLQQAIRSREETEVKQIIQDICKIMQSKGHSLLAFRILYNDIIHMMLTELNENQTSFENIYSVFSLPQCLTIKDFNDILWEVCCTLMDSNTISVKKNKDFVMQAVAYMKSEYMNPELNMSSLAEYLNVSSVTLAVEFKNVMGNSPSDYLAILRIERAKNLLKEKDILGKDVGIAVGYEDYNVFIRRFKKYVGKTPGQYRDEMNR